jgi:hypothetical protein
LDRDRELVASSSSSSSSPPVAVSIVDRENERDARQAFLVSERRQADRQTDTQTDREKSN